MARQVSLRSKLRACIFCLITSLAVSGVASGQRYSQTDLVSDVPGPAATRDPNCTSPPGTPGCALLNSWGMAFSSTSPVWIADNGSGLSTLYTGTGNVVPLIVTIPLPPGSTGTTVALTAIVFNGGEADGLIGIRTAK